MAKATWIDCGRTGQSSDPVFVAMNGSTEVSRIQTKSYVKFCAWAEGQLSDISSVGVKTTSGNLLIAPQDKYDPSQGGSSNNGDGGSTKPDTSSGFSLTRALQFAAEECKHNYTWRGANKARKYTKKFEGVFGRGRFPWCAAFVTWCCEQAGLNMPVQAPHTSYTFALVEAWQTWAQKVGFYHDHDGKFEPKPGDIVLFDWDQTSINQPDSDWEDHIGFFLRKDGSFYVCLEGNYRDKTAQVTRKSVNIQGFVRIPDGYKF